MDLKTEYLGLTLRTPLVPSASPLFEDLDNIKRAEDAGASAVVLPSLFEEQLRLEGREIHHHMTSHREFFSEAQTFYPEPGEVQLGSDSYLELVSAAKGSVGIPIIASLNGASQGGWTTFARQIEEAGADALELNVYSLPTDSRETSAQVEKTTLDILKTVKSVVNLPVAMKLSPFYSHMVNMAAELDRAGARGLVLFNRFYQPDIDLENLEITPKVLLSTPQDLRLPLTWIGILWGRIKGDLAATSGIHTERDVLKMIMVGASVTMVCSVLFKRGIDHIRLMEQGLVKWMEEHEYESVSQMRGSMSQEKCPDPSAFERAQYMKAIKTVPPL